MTYPPQPPGGGPYGPPPTGPFGQQPPGPYGPPPGDQLGPQTPYQGLGYPGSPPPIPPRKRNTTMVVIVVVAILVLAGAGTAIFLLTRDRGDTPASTPTTADGPNSPAAVQQAYIEAYETKSFGSVVASACQAYKDKFGTDTTKLEKQLEPYQITAENAGDPEVSGNSATALIDLELTKDGETKTPHIKIKIVKEGGQWRFCGEGEA